MSYIAKKVCSFGGMDFLIGNPIPDGLIKKDRVADLVKMGVISVVPDAPALEDVVAQVGQVKFALTIHADEGDLALEFSEDEVQQVFDVLQGNVDEAKAVISEVTSENVLIMVEVLDNRKSVKSLVDERAAELFPQ